VVLLGVSVLEVGAPDVGDEVFVLGLHSVFDWLVSSLIL
jgi:hypothetical protein